MFKIKNRNNKEMLHGYKSLAKYFTTETEPTNVYCLYQKGVEHHNRIGLYSKSAEAYRMFLGNQWEGIEGGEERLPVFNIIQPTVQHKTATVAAKSLSIHYSPANCGENQAFVQDICNKLNAKAMQSWELLKMEKIIWQAVKDACIVGDSYLFFYDGTGAVQQVDNTAVYLSDEGERNLQKQKYIIIAERRWVDEIKKEARLNGLSEEEIALIKADTDSGTEFPAAENEVDADKCLSLLKMWKQNGGVHFCRSTRTVVYQRDTAIEGLRLYPLANFVWTVEKGSARGVGEVKPLVANQVEINRNLARRLINAKVTAFPRLVYAKGRLANPDTLAQVGTALELEDTVSAIGESVAYLQPVAMSADAKNLSDELVYLTRELAGAGEAATGAVNPENASGAAIIAARNQAVLPLNEQMADLKQFVEDVALIWYDLWRAYNPNGLTVVAKVGGHTEETVLAPRFLAELKLNIRIDISQNDPFSRYAQEQALDKLFTMKELSLAEYVEALDDAGSVPKGKLQDILLKRSLPEVG
jgi:hypothetical protein